MGLAKIGLKRISEGKRDALAGIALDEKRGASSGASLGWQELGLYLERAGDLAGAAQAYHQYRRLIDQSLRADTRKAVLEAQAKYDDERRAKEIELLNRDMSLKAEQLRERDLRLKLWAALGGCVLLSAVLLGLTYQRIRKTNQALASSNAALRVQGERDPLTGLSNRRHFQAAIKRLADQGKLSGTVFLIDIDHFKRINDAHGHAAGDSVLVEVAKRLRASVRDEDLVVRWGGEEFLIVVDTRDAADADHAGALAQRLLDSLGSRAVEHGQTSVAVSIHLTASIGFASFPVAPHGLALSWERAIDLVDTVMYMAKAHGRNKAYGIQAIDATDEAGLLRLAGRMEAAWHEGSIRLLALQGPEATAAPA
jgi:diguanylate cyclase (GGDEF)-like protein